VGDVISAWRDTVETLECLLATSAIARNKHDPRALLRKLAGRNFTYARSCASDDDGFALHGVRPSR
jgi:hypothetical protein